MAAVAASQTRPGSVLLLEKEPRVGRKLLATGNGRCNLLNLSAGPEHYHGGGAQAAASLLSRMPPKAVIARFEALGLHVREEEDGRIYPYSGQASAVLDVLRAACGRQGVKTLCGAEVVRITPGGGAFTLRMASGEAHAARRVILAAGGMAAPAFGASGQSFALLSGVGHTVVPPMPALSPLRLPAERVRGLKGVRVRATLALVSQGAPQGEARGEALFTEYGVSGIAAMRLSRRAGELLRSGKDATLSIRLLDTETAEAQMERRLSLYKNQSLESFFTGLLHSRVALCLLREAGLSAGAPVTLAAAGILARLLADWQVPILSVLPFEHAQATAGGAVLEEFHPQTLESLILPGFYACGEALDVDGDCGGYNLLWAWVSGAAAGENAGKP